MTFPFRIQDIVDLSIIAFISYHVINLVRGTRTAQMLIGFLIVLGPLIFRTALRYAPWLEPLEGTFNFFRFAIAAVVLTIALFVAHKWLPAGRRRVMDILPGILATLAL